MRPSFYSIDRFPKLATLLQNWKIIREEFKTLNAPVMNIDRVGNKSHEQVKEEVLQKIQQGEEYGWVLGWRENWGDNVSSGINHDWLQYGLVIYDFTPPFVKQKMPQTITLLQEIKGIKVCALVKMKPNSILPCHQHPEIFKENLLQMHITLDTANEKNYAYLNVNGAFRQHICGEAIIFDGSLDHFAFNASASDRTILYMEFEKNKLMI